MSQPSIDERVQEAVDQLLKGQSIEEAFVGFLVHREGLKKECCLETLRKVWNNLPKEYHELAIKSFITCIHNQTNEKRAKLLFDMLEPLVENHVVSAKSVCEALVTCEKLSYRSSKKWCCTFEVIRRIVGGVDYKGVRDLLRIILEKAQCVPTGENVCTLQLIEIVMKVVRYILDRNACLLPSYFAVNEITKLCVDDKPWPHWRMGLMLSEFVQTFRSAAQMVTISGRSSLLPVVGHSSSSANVWKLNPNTLRFPLSGPLPYDKLPSENCDSELLDAVATIMDLYDAQTQLLRYVLEQPYSRDMVCAMLSLNKQRSKRLAEGNTSVKERCAVLEEQLVDLVVLAMERSETDEQSADDTGVSQLLWQHLSSQLIFFVLFQFASFPHMVLALYEKLRGRNLRKGRDHLMWVLLQFISGSIQKNPLEDFLPVLRLYDLLYSDKELIPLPDVSKASSTHAMAVTCIWIHLNKKAQTNKVRLQRPTPHALKGHLDFLKQSLSNIKNLQNSDYCIALLCNAYSTNPDFFALPMGILVESIYGNTQTTTTLPGNISAPAPTKPLPMGMLDSLTVHAKMSLIHSIVTRVIRLAQTKSTVPLAPALVETYSRLLVYMEIESLGIKGFISQLLPSVFKSNAWGILHTLLEMFSYRLHHIQPLYRVQLLSNLHALATVPQTNQNQLHLCVESTALRLIMGLGSSEVQPQLSRVFNEPKTMVLLSSESEELNRALVLTLARAMHVTGSESLSSTWWRDILSTIMKHTPHSWSSHTLSCFPPALSDFFQQNPVTREDKATIKKNVDTEYRKWKSMASEGDLIAHFSMQGTPTLFLCVLWRSLLEDNRISPTAYKVLERLGPRMLSAHLRTFADYLVHEFSVSAGGIHVNKCLEKLNDLIWKCHVVPIDRLVLCLALRSLEGNEAQVCFFIIQSLLLKPPDFRSRVQDFVKENSPEHWKQDKWHEKHMNFHRKFPEKFYFEGLQDMNPQPQPQYLPIYFGNVCLRFLPVFDIVIHRFLELPPVSKSLESLFDRMGGLYKFHDRPMTYLYNTLHYYEKKLKDRPALKKRLVQAIIGSLKDIRPPNWCLSEDYQKFLARDTNDTNWVPEPEYYTRLISRLVDTMAGKNPAPFPNCDWRFNEFPNPAAHALHATCIELMALPVSSQAVGNALLDIILDGTTQIRRDKIMAWMNAIGLVLTALPDGYWMVLNDRIIDTMKSPALMNPSPDCQPFLMFNFTAAHQVVGEQHCSYVLALCHAVWQHASIGQLSSLPSFLREKLRPLIQTEEQGLFTCHLVGPFLQRFHMERTRCLLELTVELYEILEVLDKKVKHLNHMDPLTDFLYHIKYMFVGDGVKGEVEKVIRNLRPALQLRLRFISHHGKEEATSVGRLSDQTNQV